MNDHEIIRLAIKAGLAKQMEDNQYRINQFNELTEFVALVEQQERLACYNLREMLHPMNFGTKETYTADELIGHMKQSIEDYADTINARNKHEQV